MALSRDTVTVRSMPAAVLMPPMYAKLKYDATADADALVIERVAKVADERGVSMTEVALAWTFAKGVAAPIVGATKVPHFDAAVKAVDLTLSAEDVAYLEEPYKAHEVSGAIARP